VNYAATGVGLTDQERAEITRKHRIVDWVLFGAVALGAAIMLRQHVKQNR